MENSRERSSPFSLESPPLLAAATAASTPFSGHFRQGHGPLNPSYKGTTSSTSYPATSALPSPISTFVFAVNADGIRPPLDLQTAASNFELAASSPAVPGRNTAATGVPSPQECSSAPSPQLSFSPQPQPRSPSTSKPLHLNAPFSAFRSQNEAASSPVSSRTAVCLGNPPPRNSSSPFPLPFSYTTSCGLKPSDASSSPCFVFTAGVKPASSPCNGLLVSSSATTGETTSSGGLSGLSATHSCFSLDGPPAGHGVLPRAISIGHSNASTGHSNVVLSVSNNCHLQQSFPSASCTAQGKTPPNLNFKFGSLEFPPIPSHRQPLNPAFPSSIAIPNHTNADAARPSLVNSPLSNPASSNASPSHKHKSRSPRRVPPPHRGKGILPSPPLFMQVVPFLSPVSGFHLWIPLLCHAVPLGLKLHASGFHPSKRPKASRRKRPNQPPKSSPTAPPPKQVVAPPPMGGIAAGQHCFAAQYDAVQPPVQTTTSPSVTTSIAPSNAPILAPKQTQNLDSNMITAAPLATALNITQSATISVSATAPFTTAASTTEATTSATALRPSSLARQRGPTLVKATTIPLTKPKQGKPTNSKAPSDQSHRRCPRKAQLFATDH